MHETSPLLLFMDFDGVTHSVVGSTGFEPNCMAAMYKALDPFNLSIVVASSWREDKSLDQLRILLAPLNKTVAGITPIIDDPFLKYVRYHEVQQYLEESQQPSMPWFAIDDTPGFYPQDAPVYWTDPKTGFIEDDIMRFQKWVLGLTKNGEE